MEGGGSGGVLGAAREPREEEKGAAAAAERKGGPVAGMKFHVSARAPHGVAALLLIGGTAVVGAAVLAWRRSRRGNKAAERQRDRQPASRAEVSDGGVVEDGKVQGGALVQKLDQSNENLSAEKKEIGSGILDGKATEESHQIHKDNEIVAGQLVSEPEETIDQNSGKNPVEVNMDDTDKEQAEKIDQNSSTNHVEITTDDMCQEKEHVEKIDHVEGIDQNSSRDPVEIVMQEVITFCLIPGNVEKVDEDSSKNNIEKEIAQKDDKDVKASDQSKLSISGPGIIFSKNNDESDGVQEAVQEAESMENTPTAQLMMQQDQLLDDMVTDTVTETEEAIEGEGTITDRTELEQDEKKALAGLTELVSSPAVSSLVKPAEKKGPEFPGFNERGMKIVQDYTNGELRKHDMISKGEVQGGAIATMDRRSPALAILALIFAMTIGITIIVCIYAPTRAKKLQMDL
ncbi:uncharacterized protein LOC120699730 isoform X2 [Panicum virgatum]|uniref:Uncharacterized protein n=1 Tax=Panicum virgatum TaxID=38727 RepID=A0A8T0V5P4_PANVG|nr:uncharacterized protein LOC120699730 isoform X2 [Panicum virgatum]KAG2629848.1 hypothetical protein PVAP13_3KG507200 [Panicum virgatum]